MHVRIQSEGGRGLDPPLKNHKNIGFSSNTGPVSLKIAATKPTFNVGPSSVRQQWLAGSDGPLIVILGSSLLSSTKKKKKKKPCQSWTPSDKTFWICACSFRRWDIDGCELASVFGYPNSGTIFIVVILRLA